nr:ATP-binding protein [Scatolibacter rhodanostii]
MALHIMDIVQNSIAAKANLMYITIEENIHYHTLLVEVCDDGIGMTAQQVQLVTDPFYTTRTTRNIGLGVPLLKKQAENTGGKIRVDSALGKGTTVSALFHTESMNMLSLGDINAVILLLITANPALDFVFERRVCKENEIENKKSLVDTRELKQVLGEEISLSYPDVVLWLKNELKEMENDLET